MALEKEDLDQIGGLIANAVASISIPAPQDVGAIIEEKLAGLAKGDEDIKKVQDEKISLEEQMANLMNKVEESNRKVEETERKHIESQRANSKAQAIRAMIDERTDLADGSAILLETVIGAQTAWDADNDKLTDFDLDAFIDKNKYLLKSDTAGHTKPTNDVPQGDEKEAVRKEFDDLIAKQNKTPFELAKLNALANKL